MIDVVKIAQVCHEANRAFCSVNGDNSQVPWEEAPEWMQQTAANGVEFCLANPNATDSAFHDAWCEDKVRDGWKHGQVKDAEKKEHPCLVPFNHLPLHQQQKDILFKAIVLALSKE